MALEYRSRVGHIPDVVNPPKQNRNRFLFLTQLVAVAGGVLIFGARSYCV